MSWSMVHGPWNIVYQFQIFNYVRMAVRNNSPIHDAWYDVIERNSLRLCSFALPVSAAITMVGKAIIRPISIMMMFLIDTAITCGMNMLNIYHSFALISIQLIWICDPKSSRTYVWIYILIKRHCRQMITSQIQHKMDWSIEVFQARFTDKL